MKHLIKTSAFFISALLLAVGCKPDLEIPTADPGTADFSTYVALGNSLTAGYSDGALYLEPQINSYPAIMARQMEFVGLTGGFKQPLVPAGNGSGGASGKLVLVVGPTGTPLPMPTTNDPNVFRPIGAQGPFQNMGVPGARSFHLLAPGFGSAQGNPFFARFASSPVATVVDDALASNPTFYSLWIGNNDILGYALDGGRPDASPITPVDQFNASIDGIVARMASRNPNIKAAIANIPDILKIPYFTTVPWNGITLGAADAALLNAGIQQQVRGSVRIQVTEAVRQQVRTQVEVGVRTQVRTQVEENVRAQTRPRVEVTVFQQTEQTLLTQGATPEQARTQAQAFVQSEEGQALITAQVNQQMSSPATQELISSLITQQMATPTVQQTITDQIAAQMASPQVQGLIDQNTNQQMTQLTPVLPTFREGANGFLVEDTRSPIGFRMATASDRILLPFLATINSLPREQVPQTIIPDAMFIDAEEAALISNARNAYNTKLQQVCLQRGYALVNISAFFDQIDGGFSFDAVSYSTAFVTGGAFSLDGVHITQRGAALIANEFIRAINQTYKASIPPVNVNQFEGVRFPGTNSTN